MYWPGSASRMITIGFTIAAYYQEREVSKCNCWGCRYSRLAWLVVIALLLEVLWFLARTWILR